MLSLAIAAALSSPGAAAAPPADTATATRLAELYREVCLAAFPDDAAVEADLSRRGADRLSAGETRIYLHDDPGTAWRLGDGDGAFIVTIEQPPYHSCGVRRQAPGPLPDDAYRAIVAAYRQGHPEFTVNAPADLHRDGNAVHMTIEQRATGNGTVESLIVVVDTPDDARISPETRYVHQFYAPTGRS